MKKKYIELKYILKIYLEKKEKYIEKKISKKFGNSGKNGLKVFVKILPRQLIV